MIILPDRFWAKVDKSAYCWLWTAARNHGGYGIFSYCRRPTLAHRLSYVAAKGAIQSGLFLDHLCRVRHCVNPDHLEAVSLLENIQRGNSNFRKYYTHCRNGHEYRDENTYRTPDGKRACRVCNANAAARYRMTIKLLEKEGMLT